MRIRATFWLTGLLLLIGCGGTTPRGDAGQGQQLFHGELLMAGGDATPCIGCHSVTPGEPPAIGPNLSNVGNRAATTVAAQSAADYLRASVVEPDTYLAAGFQEGIHPRTYGQLLTNDQINDLVAYMLTLRSGQD
ncbi:MAG: c-type cytochrome [Chloroflexota bacterium]|nr:c-type cytochrome [Chloroflexota bacterium]PLS77923.1 MAG: hypothetical protein CYG59_21205 [Chloroflexota bacterium]